MRGHRRDLTLNRNFVEEEREAMLTSLHDHIFLSTQEQDKCAEIGSSGFMSPTATCNDPIPQEFRVEVTKPMLFAPPRELPHRGNHFCG